MMQHTGTLTSPRKPQGQFKSRKQYDNPRPAPLTPEQVKAAFKPIGSTATRKKNRSQRMFVKALFPALFVGDHPMPMQTGIKDEMLTAIVRRGLDISEERLQMALRACCASLVYRTRMCSMRFRRDINGVAVEAISKEDKKHAWQQIVDYRLRHKLPQLRPQWLKGSRKKGPMKGRSAQPRKGVKPSRPVQASQPAAR